MNVTAKLPPGINEARMTPMFAIDVDDPQGELTISGSAQTIQRMYEAMNDTGLVTVKRARLWELIEDYASAEVAHDVFNILGIDPLP